MITTVLFDLDGTLLPMDQEVFTKRYFKGLTAKLAPHGYEPKQLIDAVWAGTAAMVRNNGERSNEAVFWDKLASIFGEGIRADEALFADFYAKEFDETKSACGYAPQAAEIVREIKKRGLQVALATNPIFPAIATEKRIRWTGLEPTDFAIYTTYENSAHCKPNPAYYHEVAQRLGVHPQECVMIGNDATEDLAAREIGIDVFLLTDCLINTQGKDLADVPHGSFEALSAYLSELK